mmetsp:Transcript_10008/g.30282  ORF Transcript_10008/g.30282 Transcript_10008/m.30282 type:complete len:232 (+) Transcript_10008:855-1550(+)
MLGGALALLLSCARAHESTGARRLASCLLRLQKGQLIKVPPNASAQLKQRVRYGQPLPIRWAAHAKFGTSASPLPGAQCREDVGAYRQTCCVVDETGIPFDHVLVNGTFERIYALSKPAASGATNGSVPPPSQNASGLRCYPRLVIFGAQKAGSTALAALLAESGPVKFARRKELHYFDQASIWCRGTLPYLTKFPPLEPAPPPFAPDVRACVAASLVAVVAFALGRTTGR